MTTRLHATPSLLLFLATLLALAGASCLSVSRPYPGKRQFALASQTPRPSPESIGGVLEVRRFRAAPPFEEREFVYWTDAATVEPDFYNTFVAQPAALVREETRRWLERSGLFDAVIARGSLAAPDYFLEGAIVTLAGDYTAADRPRAVLEIEFLLLEDRQGAYRPRATWTFRRDTPTDGRHPEALVKAWSAALGEVLGSLQEALLAELSTPSRDSAEGESAADKTETTAAGGR